MQPPHHIFDRKLKRLQRVRAAGIIRNHDFLLREVSGRMIERIQELESKNFRIVAELGCRHGLLEPRIRSCAATEYYVNSELCEKYAADVVLDEEWLPFQEKSVNLFLSLLNLHWVNDLPGALVQLRQALAEKGLLLATLFGGQTLKELRHAMMLYEDDARRGVSPRISPFVDVKDAGMLLQRAGYHMPVADSETLTVKYKNALELMRDLKNMGENNALGQRPRGLITMEYLEGVSATYASLYESSDGSIPATFEIVTLTGWKN